jgi:hypothetical protein
VSSVLPRSTPRLAASGGVRADIARGPLGRMTWRLPGWAKGAVTRHGAGCLSTIKPLSGRHECDPPAASLGSAEAGQRSAGQHRPILARSRTLEPKLSGSGAEASRQRRDHAIASQQQAPRRSGRCHHPLEPLADPLAGPKAVQGEPPWQRSRRVSQRLVSPPVADHAPSVRTRRFALLGGVSAAEASKAHLG